MTEALAAAEAEKVVDAGATAETTAETGKEASTAANAGSEAGKTAAEKGASEASSAEFVADPTKTDEDNAKALAEWEKANESKNKSGLPDDWRERAANGDEDLLKQLKRYGSLSGVAKALVEAKKALRSGRERTPMPDPGDEKAMAEWRKAEGIPDEPTGYQLPEAVTKRMVDEDKPILSAFTEYAHKKNARPDVVEIASEWYVDMAEAAAAKQNEDDAAFADQCETALRKDWAHGEYKANLQFGKRWADTIPGVGEKWTEMRAPDGRRLGDIPEFVAWAADQGRAQFGDLAFATGDAERSLMSRKAEIEKIRDTDFDAYDNDPAMRREYQEILDKEMKRAKR